MKAWIFDQVNHNPIIEKIHLPEPNQDELLVDVLASAINHRDVWITKGKYPGITKGIIMGSDACVSHQGKQYVINPSIDWGENQRVQADNFTVLGMPENGSFAQKMVIAAKYLYPKPQNLSIIEAAACPLAGLTAYRALLVKTQVKSGESVLISGIGGGVAMFAMQLALALGCKVFVTSSDQNKLDQAITMGAKGGYNYNNPDWTKQLMADVGGVDVVIDGACGTGFNDLVKVCNPGARIAFYGGTQGKIDGLNPQIIFWRQISIFGSTMGSDKDFEDMLAFVETHHIKPIIDEVIPFEEISRGFDKMAAGKQFGKIVFQH